MESAKITTQFLRSLPLLLREQRLAAGLTQKALAEKLEMREQQIQRYEATNYQSASLHRLLEVAEAIASLAESDRQISH